MRKLLAVITAVLLLLSLSLALAEDAEDPALILNESEITVAVGREVRLSPTVEGIGKKKPSYEWTSSDESVATVKKGAVKGQGKGTAVITCTAKLEDGSTLTVEATVTVIIPVKGIVAETKKLSLAYGETQPIVYKIQPEDATIRDLEWKSSNEAVATVDQEGHVTGNVPGKATVTGTSRDGSKKQIKISVTVTTEDDPPGLQLLISALKTKQKKGFMEYSYTIQNNSDRAVKGVSFYLCYFALDGHTVFTHDVETGQLYNLWRALDLKTVLKPRQKDSIQGEMSEFHDRMAVSSIRMAVRSITYEDGSTVEIPASQLYWIDSDDGYLPRSIVKNVYKNMPSEEVLNTAEGFSLGIQTLPMCEIVASEYVGSPEPGRYIFNIVAGSPAEASELRMKDVIYGVDEMSWKNEPFCIDYGMARLAEDKPVTFHVVRGGEYVDVTFTSDGESTMTEASPMAADEDQPEAEAGNEEDPSESGSGEDLPEDGGEEAAPDAGDEEENAESDDEEDNPHAGEDEADEPPAEPEPAEEPAEAAEPVEVIDNRIAQITTDYACGCHREKLLGTMVGPEGMVVPAAALYCPTHGKRFVSVRFRFGVRADGSVFLDYGSEFTFIAYENFENGFNAENAVAYVKFPIAIGNMTGWYDCKAATDKQLKAQPLRLRFVSENNATLELEIRGTPESETMLSVSRTPNVTSGCPVFLSAAQGDPVLVAIVTGENDEEEQCRRITKDIYNDMKKDKVIK